MEAIEPGRMSNAGMESPRIANNLRVSLHLIAR